MEIDRDMNNDFRFTFPLIDNFNRPFQKQGLAIDDAYLLLAFYDTVSGAWVSFEITDASHFQGVFFGIYEVFVDVSLLTDAGYSIDTSRGMVFYATPFGDVDFDPQTVIIKQKTNAGSFVSALMSYVIDSSGGDEYTFETIIKKLNASIDGGMIYDKDAGTVTVKDADGVDLYKVSISSTDSTETRTRLTV